MRSWRNESERNGRERRKLKAKAGLPEEIAAKCDLGDQIRNFDNSTCPYNWYGNCPCCRE
ncbi:MAG: hypothetical protein IGR93_00630 [Hydrococcus sp. C42_A2020_068]|nr:hypothetical protein [Hydrococcus sp. C42_A2020_068]